MKTISWKNTLPFFNAALEKIDLPSVNDLKNESLTEDIKSSVSELKSVITKTIENTENIEDIPSLIIEYNNSKEEGESTISTTATTTQLPTTINTTTKLPTTTTAQQSSPQSTPTTITTAKVSSTIAQTDDGMVFENSSTRDENEGGTFTTVDFVEKVIEPELMTTHKVCIFYYLSVLWGW